MSCDRAQLFQIWKSKNNLKMSVPTSFSSQTNTAMNTMRLITSILLLAVISVSTAQFMTLTQVIKSDPNFSTLYSLLQATGLDQTLDGSVLFTVFAPNNTAFDALPPATLKYLLDPANGNLLNSVIEYHVRKTHIITLSSVNFNLRSSLELYRHLRLLITTATVWLRLKAALSPLKWAVPTVTSLPSLFL